jgi:hypothetical protein
MVKGMTLAMGKQNHIKAIVGIAGAQADRAALHLGALPTGGVAARPSQPASCSAATSAVAP